MDFNAICERCKKGSALPLCSQLIFRPRVCECCKKASVPGMTYTFYYGNTVSRETATSDETIYKTKPPTKKYALAGSDILYLCDRCVFREEQRVSLRLTVLSGVLSAFLLTPFLILGNNAGFLAFFSSMGYVFGGFAFNKMTNTILVFWYLRRNDCSFIRKQMFCDGEMQSQYPFLGDKLAIRLRKSVWINKGFHHFFSRRDFENLSKL